MGTGRRTLWTEPGADRQGDQPEDADPPGGPVLGRGLPTSHARNPATGQQGGRDLLGAPEGPPPHTPPPGSPHVLTLSALLSPPARPLCSHPAPSPRLTVGTHCLRQCPCPRPPRRGAGPGPSGRPLPCASTAQSHSFSWMTPQPRALSSPRPPLPLLRPRRATGAPAQTRAPQRPCRAGTRPGPACPAEAAPALLALWSRKAKWV